MKTSLFILLSVTSISCRHEETAQFALKNDGVSHVGHCHLKMLNTADDQKPPFVGLKYVCGLPESDLEGWPKGDPKWATHPTPPLGFTLNLGDCLNLEGTYYCVESIRAGEATFRASFKTNDKNNAVLNRIAP